MKTIKIDVVDFVNGVNKDHLSLVCLLRKHYNVEFSEKPDFLFYSVCSNDFEKYDNCVKIFYADEHVLPNFNQCDYATTCHDMVLGDRFFKRYFEQQPRSINDRSTVTDDMVNRRFCNFIYSNARVGSLTKVRQDFCKKLMEYKHVDCPGTVLHNMDTDELSPRNGDWRRSKLDFLKKYKFTIAFENAIANGYTTEKMFHPLRAFSVPIYMGAPDAVKEVNPKSFINCADFNNDFDAIIERIKYLDTHDDEYLAMLREQPMQPDYDFDRLAKFEEWLCGIIEKGNKPFDNSIHRFWSTRTTNNQISALSTDNQKLKQELDDANQKLRQNNLTDIDKIAYTVETSIAKNKTQLENLQKQIDVMIAETENRTNKLNQRVEAAIAETRNQVNNAQIQILDKCVTAIKRNHNKHRKYFNVLLTVQAMMFIILIWMAF